jgi:hypothetical protein
MTTNLTLTLDEELVRRAETVARERNSSIDEVVGNLLRNLPAPEMTPAERQEAVRRLDKITRELRIELGPKTWSREDLHERGV